MRDHMDRNSSTYQALHTALKSYRNAVIFRALIPEKVRSYISTAVLRHLVPLVYNALIVRSFLLNAHTATLTDGISKQLYQWLNNTQVRNFQRLIDTVVVDQFAGVMSKSADVRR